MVVSSHGHATDGGLAIVTRGKILTSNGVPTSTTLNPTRMAETSRLLPVSLSRLAESRQSLKVETFLSSGFSVAPPSLLK